MSTIDRATRPLRAVLLLVALASPAALHFAVRSGALVAPPPVTERDALEVLLRALLGLAVALLALWAVGHAQDTQPRRRGDTR